MHLFSHYNFDENDVEIFQYKNTNTFEKLIWKKKMAENLKIQTKLEELRKICDLN